MPYFSVGGGHFLTKFLTENDMTFCDGNGPVTPPHDKQDIETYTDRFPSIKQKWACLCRRKSTHIMKQRHQQANASCSSVSTRTMLAETSHLKKRSCDNDCIFLQDVITSDGVSVFRGYNATLCGAGILPTPFMLTAIHAGLKLTSDNGQNVHNIKRDFTRDSIIFLVDIVPNRLVVLTDVIPILGGMGILVPFKDLIECVWIQDILVPSSWSLDNILSRKIAQNVWAMIIAPNPQPISIQELQKQLNGLLIYCSKNLMVANEVKTKYMIFGTREDTELYFDEKRIERVND